MKKAKNQMQTVYVDRPEPGEIFADSLHGIVFDGQTMRFEFCTTRVEQPASAAPGSARQFPVCRLVLTPNAALKLFNDLNNLMAILERDGAIKREAAVPRTVN